MMVEDNVSPKPTVEQDGVPNIGIYNPSQAKDRIRVALLRHQALVARVAPAVNREEKKVRL